MMDQKLDEDALQRKFVTVLSLLVTVIPFILAMVPEAAATPSGFVGDEGVCRFSDAQREGVDVIKSLIALQAAGWNATCTYNISIGPGGIVGL